MNTLYLSKKDVEKILEAMNKFPDGCNDSGNYQFNFDYHGIGSSLDMIIPLTCNGIKGEFSVQIINPEDW